MVYIKGIGTKYTHTHSLNNGITQQRGSHKGERPGAGADYVVSCFCFLPQTINPLSLVAGGRTPSHSLILCKLHALDATPHGTCGLIPSSNGSTLEVTSRVETVISHISVFCQKSFNKIASLLPSALQEVTNFKV